MIPSQQSWGELNPYGCKTAIACRERGPLRPAREAATKSSAGAIFGTQTGTQQHGFSEFKF
jgi:hypothetical protein